MGILFLECVSVCCSSAKCRTKFSNSKGSKILNFILFVCLSFEVRHWSHLLKRMKLLKCFNQYQQVTLPTQKMHFHSHVFSWSRGQIHSWCKSAECLSRWTSADLHQQRMWPRKAEMKEIAPSNPPQSGKWNPALKLCHVL